MYNVKGPSKIVAKTTRRGLSQNIDNFRDHNKNRIMDSDEIVLANGPKPTFNNNNSRRHFNNNNNQEIITPHHEEIIKFINESWISVCNEMEVGSIESDTSGSGNSGNDKTVTFYEDEPLTSLQDFKPFDLESWWGKRLYTYMTSSISTKN